MAAVIKANIWYPLSYLSFDTLVIISQKKYKLEQTLKLVPTRSYSLSYSSVSRLGACIEVQGIQDWRPSESVHIWTHVRWFHSSSYKRSKVGYDLMVI